MAWIDFAICLFFGYLGVHKFREKNKGMGILYLFTFGLFGIGWIYDCVKYLISALKYSKIQKGELPIITSNTVLLTDGEVCHYCESATYVKTKNVVVGYTGGSRGVSIRVMKGMSYRVGASRSAPIRGNVQEKYPGVLTITNKRVIFAGSKGAFDNKITSLSTVTPHKDGISFQFGDKQYPIMCKDPVYVYQILVRIINS